MLSANAQVAQALLRAQSKDGVHWLFVVRPNDGWTITRNGEEISVGTSARVSLAAGVGEFISLTHTTAVSDAGCSAAVGAQVDRIERARLAVVKAAAPQEWIGPDVPKGSSAYATQFGTAAP
jgi:hypothetical protein